MNNRNIAGNAILFLTALIWGCAFSAQEAGLAYMGPFSFNGIRSFVGCAFLLIVILISALFSRKKRPWNKQILIGGVICGSMLFVATSLQQIALAHTPAGKAAFITALYIVFVPFIRLIGGNKVTAFNWVGVGLACAGFWLLCITDGFAVGIGDLLLVGCAVIFAFDILAVDYFAPKVDAIKFSAVQFAVVGLLSATPIIFW